MSLPGFRIVDTYKAYKVRERKFTSWLSDTAEKLELKIPRSRKKGDPANPSIPISEIHSVVESIVSCGLSLPEDIRNVLRDVISQRKEASAFYKPQGQKESDKRHAYYITILEWALTRLESPSKKPSSEESLRVSRPATASTLQSKSDVNLSNFFDLLDDENTNTAEASAASGSESDKENGNGTKAKKGRNIRFGKRKGKGRKAARKNSKKKEAVTDDGFLDSVIASQDSDWEDEDEDLYFMIYCFFKDQNTLREYLQERWCDYQDGILSLAVVSVITNTAFEILQRAERDLLVEIPLDSGLADYQSMANLLFFDVGLAHVDYDGKDAKFEGDKQGMDDAIYEEADWIFLCRYWDVVEWLKNIPPRKVPTISRLFRDEPVRYLVEHSTEKQARDRQITYELLAECCLLKPIRTMEDNVFPGEDFLTKGIIKMLITRDPPIWLLISLQIMCDIRYILEEDVVRCHHELQRVTQRYSEILNTTLEFSKDFATPRPKAIRTTFEEIECWVTQDFIRPQRTRLHLEHGYTKDQIEPFYYLRRNPVFAGLMLFRFSLSMNEIGMTYTNSCGAVRKYKHFHFASCFPGRQEFATLISVQARRLLHFHFDIACAHLYNAMVCELREDFPIWLDMSALLLIHGPSRIFWRDKIPTRPSQYCQIYQLCTGVEEMIAQFKPHLKPNGRIRQIGPPKRTQNQGIGPVSVISFIYHDTFCFAHSPTMEVSFLPDIEKLMNESVEDELQDSLLGLYLLKNTDINKSSYPASQTSSIPQSETHVPTTNLTKDALPSTKDITEQYHKHHALTHIQLLSALGTRIFQESYALNFDYFSFNIRCINLLENLYKEFETETIKAFGQELDKEAGLLPIVAYYIFKWIEDPELGPEVLERCKKVMEGVVKEDGKIEIGALRKMLGGDKL